MKPFTKILMMGVVVSTLTLSANAFGGSNSNGMTEQRGMYNMPQRGMQQQERRRGNPIQNLLQQLNLSETQITALRSLSETFRAEREAVKNSGESRDQNFADAISESGLNSAQLVQNSLEKCEERSTMHANHMAQIVDILTAEQRLEFKALLVAKAERSNEPLKNLGY